MAAENIVQGLGNSETATVSQKGIKQAITNSSNTLISSLQDKTGKFVNSTNLGTTNAYITETGTIQSSTGNYAITDFYVVKGITDIVWNGRLTSSNKMSAVAFYDKNKIFISAVTVGTGGEYPPIQTQLNISVPEGAVFARSTSVVDDNFPFSVTAHFSGLDIDRQDYNLITDEISISGYQLITDYNVIENKYIDINGISSTHSNYDIITLNIPKNKKVSFSVYFQTAAAWCLFDKFNNLISSGLVGSHKLGDYIQVLNYYDGAKLYISCVKGYRSDFAIYFCDLDINTLLYKLEKGEQTLLNIPFNSGGYYLDGDTTLRTGVGYYTGPVDIEYLNNGKITINYASISTSWRSSIITDDKGNTLIFTSEHNVIQATMDVPVNAKYLYVSGTNKPASIIYTSRGLNQLDATVTALQEDIVSIHNNINPLDNIWKIPTYITCFYGGITAIGDSLTEGVFNTTYPHSNGAGLPGYGYPAILSKITGVKVNNYGLGGMTASRLNVDRSWLDYALNNKDWLKNADEIGDAVILYLGTNDISQLGSFTGNVSTDIDLNNLNNNALTSVGGYAAIIQYLRNINPKVSIFCSGITNDRNTESTRTEANLKIKSICELFENCYFMDMQTYAEPTAEEQNYFIKYLKNNSHPNSLGYNLRARQYMSYIDWIIENNVTDFNNIQFTRYNYDYK